MKSPLAVAFGSVLGLGTSISVVAAVEPRINGWYPCAYSIKQSENSTTTTHVSTPFECAELEVPLCYDGVCESDRMINVFVKRWLGKEKSPDASAPRKAAIYLQGGPGASSVGMEDCLAAAREDDEWIDLYTIDQRGTGRSEFLKCDVASALMPRSELGTTVSLNELPACLQDLHVQYDGQAAGFSTTSAAMDVRTMIETLLRNHHVYIVSYSYGTFLAQRILQLKVPQIRGYIFDSVDVLTTKNDPFESANSNWNQVLVKSSQRLLEFCFDDPLCPIKFKSRETVLEELLVMYDQLDAKPNACGERLVKLYNVAEPPSIVLRSFMGGYVTDIEARGFGLGIVAAVLRCNADDLEQVNMLVDKLEREEQSQDEAADALAPIDPLTDLSYLLYDVVVFSERWSQPPPTRAELDDFVRATPVTGMDVNYITYFYCLFTGSSDPACDERRRELPVSNATFFYEHDNYFDEPLTLQDHTSALVISGGLDFATPREFGELLYMKLTGSGAGVMLVDFEYGRHCQGEAVQESPDSPCRDVITRQFLQQDGNVDKIDTSRMATLPTAAFHVVPGEGTMTLV